MSFRTPLTELFGLKHPIVLAPMGAAAAWAAVSVVSLT